MKPRSAVRHCWIDGDVPALLLGWRRGAEGWEGRVAVLESQTAEPVALWLPAARLRAADV